VVQKAIIMATSNGVGAGHLIRTAAIAREFGDEFRPILFSMANSAIEVGNALNLECEFVPSREKSWMQRRKWDRYLRDRLVALIDETNAQVLTFDGVVPYPGLVAAKFKRPHINLIWIRRGMWKVKPQGLALTLQSKMMDYVIEPGDLASKYDRGPTKNREESVLTSPVTLFSPEEAFEKKSARKKLGLSRSKRMVLVQLGVGESDMNVKVKNILKALDGVKNLQVVMTREPKLKTGENLAPKSLDIKIVKYFPLAEVIRAFDAIICASGYNSVHEVLPAAIPTLFIPNTRGTDDQLARAKWCQDNNLALYSESEYFGELSTKIAELFNPLTQARLRKKCNSIVMPSGAVEIAKMIEFFANEKVSSLIMKRIKYQRLLAQSAIERGVGGYFRRLVNLILRLAALLFRLLVPNNLITRFENLERIEFHNVNRLAQKSFKGGFRLEHILPNTSKRYLEKRIKIAVDAYGEDESMMDFQISKGTVGSISLSSVTKSA
jgi:UDP-N-acetylglucosamine:LPS N-acetylglucosamine transferase